MMEGSFVLPGDVVGSTEEFIPGDCTYAKGGVIFASTAGLVKVDPKTRAACVIPKTNAHGLPPDVPVLGKPYRRDELAARLRVIAGGQS